MVRKSLFPIILVIIFTSSAYGQIGDIIGKKQRNIKHSKRSETTALIKKLAQNITEGASTDSERVTAIYAWIASNISYDNQLLLDKNLQRKIYVSEENVVKNVLERQKALCGGFAFLFRDLCESVHVSAEVIHGFTKNYSHKLPDTKTPTHTWNAVKLNGKWELLDITWSIGYAAYGEPDDFWFRTSPQEFIYSHYPENPKWTLLKNPMSLSAFQEPLEH